MTAVTAEAVVAQIADTSESGLTLSAGLRAAAAEADSRRLARALRHVARRIDEGQPLETIIAETTRRLPPSLAGLIQAASRTGQLGSVLAEWIDNRRVARQHWQRVVAALSYPLLTIFLAIVIYVFFAALIVQPFRMLVVEFGLRTSMNLTVLYWLSDTGLTWLCWASVLIAGGLVVLRLIGGRVAWSWMISQLPLVGPTWHWTGSAEMLRNLSLLVEHSIPLPEALRLAGGGTSDGLMRSVGEKLARRVEEGLPLYAAILAERDLPVSIVPLVRWAELQGELPEGLRTAARMLEGRLQVRSDMLIQIVPPIAFIFVAVMVISLFGGILQTMVNLIRGLT